MRPRRRDRVVGWIALTIVLAMAVSLVLNMLFIELGGVWARPALDRSNLLREVASLTRVMDAAPAALRPRLAEAAASHDPAYRVSWTARLADLRLPEGIDLNLHDGAEELRAYLNRPDTRILVVQPDEWPAGLSARHPTGRWQLVGVRRPVPQLGARPFAAPADQPGAGIDLHVTGGRRGDPPAGPAPAGVHPRRPAVRGRYAGAAH